MVGGGAKNRMGAMRLNYLDCRKSCWVMDLGCFRVRPVWVRSSIAILVICALVDVLVATSARADQNSDQDFGRRSETRILPRLTATWDRQLLGTALDQIAHHQRVRIWLDRRVDPSTSFSLAIRGMGPYETLDEIAVACNLRVVQLPGCAYLGPEGGARALITLEKQLQEHLKTVPPYWRSRWLSKSSWKWPRLSQPRELLHGLFAGSGITVEGLNQVPYDLWPARLLSPMSRVDRAALLLVGFDLAPRLSADGSSCRIVPFSGNAETGHAATSVSGSFQPRRQRQPKQQAHGAQDRSSDSLSQTGQSQVFSLRVREKHVGVVLQELARQLELELTWDKQNLDASGRSLDVRISCNVERASLEQLLETILKPAGLRSRRAGRRIHIEVDDK